MRSLNVFSASRLPANLETPAPHTTSMPAPRMMSRTMRIGWIANPMLSRFSIVMVALGGIFLVWIGVVLSVDAGGRIEWRTGVRKELLSNGYPNDLFPTLMIELDSIDPEWVIVEVRRRFFIPVMTIGGPKIIQP